MSLHTVDGDLRLAQQPAGDWTATADRSKSFSLPQTALSDGPQVLDGAAGTVQRIDVMFTPETAEEFGLVLRGDGIQGTRVGIRPADGRIWVDRRQSGQTVPG